MELTLVSVCLYWMLAASPSSAAALPASSATRSLYFDEPRCWSRNDPAPLPRPRTPRAQDVETIAQRYEEEDTRRPPPLCTFAVEGVYPPHEIDFILPMVKQHISVRAGVSMRTGHEGEKGREFIFRIAEAVRFIQERCSTLSGYQGGAVYLNENMAIGLYGKPIRRTVSDDGVGSSNGTNEEDEGWDLPELFPDEWFEGPSQHNTTSEPSVFVLPNNVQTAKR